MAHPEVPPAAAQPVGGAAAGQLPRGNPEVHPQQPEGRHETQPEAVADEQVVERQVAAPLEHVPGVDEPDAMQPSSYREPDLAVQIEQRITAAGQPEEVVLRP